MGTTQSTRSNPRMSMQQKKQDDHIINYLDSTRTTSTTTTSTTIHHDNHVDNPKRRNRRRLSGGIHSSADNSSTSVNALVHLFCSCPCDTTTTTTTTIKPSDQETTVRGTTTTRRRRITSNDGIWSAAAATTTSDDDKVRGHGGGSRIPTTATTITTGTSMKFCDTTKNTMKGLDKRHEFPMQHPMNNNNDIMEQRHINNVNALNLDTVHPTSGPYLGAVYWEQGMIANVAGAKSLLDISHHDPRPDDDDDNDDDDNDGEDDGHSDEDIMINDQEEEEEGGAGGGQKDDGGFPSWSGSFSPIPSSPMTPPHAYPPPTFSSSSSCRAYTHQPQQLICCDAPNGVHDEYDNDNNDIDSHFKMYPTMPLCHTGTPHLMDSMVHNEDCENAPSVTELTTITTSTTMTLEGDHEEIEISVVIPPKRLFHDDAFQEEEEDQDRNVSNEQEVVTVPSKNVVLSPPSCNDASSHLLDHGMEKQASAMIRVRNDNQCRRRRFEEKVTLSTASISSSASSLPPPTTTSSLQTQTLPSLNLMSSSSNSPWGMMQFNTLPSFQFGHPIQIKIKESYRGYETRILSVTDPPLDDDDDHRTLLDMNNLSLLSDAKEQEHFFSYDPYFSLGQYIITTIDGGPYGNGLCVQMGERYMTLQDQNERIWGVIRSRHTWIPSAVIYSPKKRFRGQIPSSHRPLGNGRDDGEGVELYPWALVRKHGRRMDHDVTIHMVAESSHVTRRCDLLGGLFEKKPAFRSRHGLDDMGNHQYTVVHRVDDDEALWKGYLCCKSVRDPMERDLFDVTISPGIDPLMIICYLAAHSKMDVEPMLCGGGD